MKMENKCLVLMVDDDEDDFFLVRSAFKQNGFTSELRLLPNGQELMDYLYRRGIYSDPSLSPRPRVILLDLNMPQKDGRQTLREIKSDPDLKSIDVVIFTTSWLEEDKASTLELGASSFITKPTSFNELVEVFKVQGARWFRDC